MSDMPADIPEATTLEEAQELIKVLCTKLLEQMKVIESQGKQIESQAEQIKSQGKQIEELKEKLNTNSRNSSKPPSTDGDSGQKKDKEAKADKKRRKQGAQTGHVGKGRNLFSEDEITHTRVCFPEERCACGGDVRKNGLKLKSRHQTIEIPELKPIITEYQVYAGTCSCCGRSHEGTLPAGVSQRLIEPKLLALIGTLTGGYRLSKRLVQGLLQDLYRIDLCVGVISESEAIISCALQPIVEEAHTHLKEAAVVHSDETGHREKNQKQWMWVGISGCVSVFLARAHRSAEIAKELLGTTFAGILISDRYSAYSWVMTSRRQLCWAHLIRDFTKISERSGAAGVIGQRLLRYTKRMFICWHRVRDGTLPRKRFNKNMVHIQAKVETILHEGLSCEESKTANTCEALLKLRSALWTFAHTEGVEPTNNLAERTIRSYVIWRKTSFGTQSKRGSQYMERVMTVVGSCKLQGRNILEFMTQAIQAHNSQSVAPSLLPG